MARFNEILVGRYNRYLQKLLQIKGGPPSAQVASEIMGQINLFHGSETMYLQGWDLFAAGFDIGPVAAVTSGVRLRNPVNSGVVGVVYKLWASSTLNSKILLNSGVIATDFTPFTVQGLDSRGRLQGSLIASQGTGAIVFGTNIGNYFEPAAAVQEMMPDAGFEFPILPGSAFQLTTNVQNTELVGGIWWRERALEESELK